MRGLRHAPGRGRDILPGVRREAAVIRLLPLPLFVLAILQGAFALSHRRRRSPAPAVWLLAGGGVMALAMGLALYGVIFFYGL